MPTISLGSHQNIGLHTGARANVVLLTYLLTRALFMRIKIIKYIRAYQNNNSETRRWHECSLSEVSNCKHSRSNDSSGNHTIPGPYRWCWSLLRTCWIDLLSADLCRIPAGDRRCLNKQQYSSLQYNNIRLFMTCTVHTYEPSPTLGLYAIDIRRCASVLSPYYTFTVWDAGSPRFQTVNIRDNFRTFAVDMTVVIRDKPG